MKPDGFDPPPVRVAGDTGATTLGLKIMWLVIIGIGSGLAVAAIRRSNDYHFYGQANPWEAVIGLLVFVGAIITLARLSRRQRAARRQGAEATTAPPQRLGAPRMLVSTMLSFGLLLGGGLAMVAGSSGDATLYTTRPDRQAQLSLGYAQHQILGTASEFSEVLASAVPRLVMTSAPVTRVDQVSVTRCADGPACQLTILATRSANGTCWYLATGVGRRHFEGFIGPNDWFSGSPGHRSCTSGPPGTVPTADGGWQVNSWPQSWVGPS